LKPVDQKDFSVKRLDRQEFQAALAKGQGRARLHALRYGLDDLKDLVLEACLHNQVYDQQSESSRGEWLYEIIKDSPCFPEFRDAILAALETELDFWDQFQLCELTKEIASSGDDQARQKLREFVYRNAADPEAEGDWLGIHGLLFLDGVEGLIQLARIFGQRLLADPEELVYDSILYHAAYPQYAKILKLSSQSDPLIERYWKYLKKRKRASARPSIDREKARKKYSLTTILDNARNEIGEYPGRYMSFGKHATPDELEELLACLLNEVRNPVRRRLLWVFRRAKLPRIDQIILDWANADDDQLRSAAIEALAQISDPGVHALARMKLESAQASGIDWNVLHLFINNFETGDEILIKSWLDHLQPAREDAHSLGYSLLRMMDQQENPVLSDLLLWVYENIPCANCRYFSVRWLNKLNLLPDPIRFECQFDSDEDIRAQAQIK